MQINTIKENIINYLKSKSKLILFIIIFAVVCSIYNLDNQSINYFLKRGVILEYSMLKDTNVDSNALKKKLIELGVKYSFIDLSDTSKLEIVDSDNKVIVNTLKIGLAKKALSENTALFNSISDYIFTAYPYSKLIELRSLNDNYSKPYNAFLKGFNVILASFLIWMILLQLLLKKENFTKTVLSNVITFLKKIKDETVNLIQKTKENGFLYLVKKLLLDDNKDESETDFTKEIVSTILFVIVFVIIIRFFIGELRWIPSGSMRPTILEKDRVFVEKLNYPKKEIKRGDILVFYPPETTLSNNPIAVFSRLTGIFCKDIAFIKRVVGMPNDKFEIKQDPNHNEYRVYINDIALNEPYISSKINWTPCNEEMHCGPFIIPDNNYFMMGDNRNNSQDSRFWGFLDGSRVIGRANFMFFPLRRINLLKDKYLILDKEKTLDSTKENTYILNRYELLYRPI